MEIPTPPTSIVAEIESVSNTNGQRLNFVGKRVPWTTTTVFVTQVIVVYAVIIAAIVNLTFFPEGRQELWITLLSSSIGYLLPSPTIKKPKSSKASSLQEVSSNG
jgi:hypothetical protein